MHTGAGLDFSLCLLLLFKGLLTKNPSGRRVFVVVYFFLKLGENARCCEKFGRAACDGDGEKGRPAPRVLEGGAVTDAPKGRLSLSQAERGPTMGFRGERSSRQAFALNLGEVRN